MNIEDRVYGEVEIKEPALLEIINSPTLQRLKDIEQGGYIQPFLPNTQQSRFGHSIGVFLLLRRYGAPIEEQIAGLIHDVSHSAFSHCIDYILDTGSGVKQDHQDNIFDAFVRKSDIPAILKKYNYDLEYILDDKNFPLKENDLPDLCADRIDYSLRDACVYGEIKDTKYFLDNLMIKDGLWFFKNFESAKKYAELFSKLNNKYYAGLYMAVVYQAIKDYLRHAFSKKYITKTDLYTTDKIILSKIEPHHKNDPRLQLLFDRMNNKIGFSDNPNDFDGEIFLKSRAVDPFCMHDGKMKKVSEIDSSWGVILEKESKPKHFFIKFER